MERGLSKHCCIEVQEKPPTVFTGPSDSFPAACVGGLVSRRGIEITICVAITKVFSCGLGPVFMLMPELSDWFSVVITLAF